MGDADGADGLAAAQKRYGDQAPQVCPDGGDARELGVCLEIGDVDDGPVQNGDSHRERTFRRSREALDDAVDAIGREVLVSDQVEQLAVVSHHQGGQAAAEAEGVARDGVEHRLGVAGRGRDEAQDLGGGGLLLAAGLDLHGRSIEVTSRGRLLSPRRASRASARRSRAFSAAS